MKTALITGATEGIGLELAKIFAAQGNNLILVARSESRLQAVAQELSAKNNIQVQVYSKDLSVLDNAKYIYNDLQEKSIAIDFLVNNAGFGINGKYVDIDWTRELEMYNLNMITLAYFTKVFAQDMKARKFGKILNVASTAAFQPAPSMAGYSA